MCECIKQSVLSMTMEEHRDILRAMADILLKQPTPDMAAASPRSSQPAPPSGRCRS